LEEQVFRFGIEGFLELTREAPTLGVYGIGLKRSFFKMGKNLTLETDDGKNLTNVNLNVEKWIDDKVDENDWDIKGKTKHSILKNSEKPFTNIIIEQLNEDVSKQLSNVVFIKELRKSISKMYTFFIENKIDFFLNDEKISHVPISVRRSEMLQPSTFKGSYQGVNIEIICFLQPGKKGRTTEFEHKGWNIFCNDRLILLDDQTPMSGWSGKPGELPKFHNLYNEFRGFTRLYSNDPALLPLNTTKTGLILEHKVYKYTLNKMITLTKPFISFLNKKYPPHKTNLDEIENISESEIDEGEGEEKIEIIPLSEFTEDSKFVPPPEKKKMEDYQYITYKKRKELIDKVKKYLSLRTATQVGSKTFDYFIEKEKIDNERD
jgi:hypothetical protein